MMWQTITFLEKTEGDKDARGNPVITWEEGPKALARLTPWSDVQLAMTGRTVTSDEQRYAVRIPYDRIKSMRRVKVDSIIYDITEMIDVKPRYTIIGVKVFKK